MGSLRGAGIVVVVMTLLTPAVSLVVGQAGTFAESGDAIPLGWRWAIAVTNWYVRLLPFIAIGGVCLAALIGGVLSRRCPIAQERRALLGWLLLAGASLAVPIFAALHPLPIGHISANWIHGLTVLTAVEVVAPAAAVLVAAHLQARIREDLASRVRGWHIALSSGVLVFLGPALLGPPVWVWLRARHFSKASAR